MIRKTEHNRKMYVKTFDAGFKDKTHLEQHKVTTYYFLFIPIYMKIELTGSAI